MIVGLLHPGEMGAAVGRCLQANKHEVVWASEGRSAASRERAEIATEVTFEDGRKGALKADLKIRDAKTTPIPATVEPLRRAS